jgi:hypothetical protein
VCPGDRRGGDPAGLTGVPENPLGLAASIVAVQSDPESPGRTGPFRGWARYTGAGGEDSPPAHSVPAVQSGPSRQLAEPRGRDRCALTTARLVLSTADDDIVYFLLSRTIRIDLQPTPCAEVYNGSQDVIAL